MPPSNLFPNRLYTMRSIRSILFVAAVFATVAAPAHAQRIADLAPGVATEAPAQPMLAPDAGTLSASRDLAPALRPPRVVARGAATRRLSVAGHAAVGAGVGAATGALGFLAMYALTLDCRSPDSMCGLAIPVMVGGGAVTGAVAGAVVGLIRNR
jgi:hypothetical protein